MRLVIFRGEPWTRVTWLDWINALASFGVGLKPADLTREDWLDLCDFTSEWFRDLFEGGKATGMTDFEKR